MSPSFFLRSAGSALLFSLAACSGGTTADSGVDRDAGIDAATSDAGQDAGATVDGGHAMDGGSDLGATADAGVGDAAVGSGTLTVTGFTAYGDCMPIVSADPIHSFWFASIAGAAGSTATLVDAKLTITGSRTVTQHLTLDVPDIALTAGAGTADQHKTGADANPGDVCGELCSGATAALDLIFDTADGRLTAHVEAPYSCAF